jgi:hypothetical protein
MFFATAVATKIFSKLWVICCLCRTAWERDFCGSVNLARFSRGAAAGEPKISPVALVDLVDSARTEWIVLLGVRRRVARLRVAAGSFKLPVETPDPTVADGTEQAVD